MSGLGGAGMALGAVADIGKIIFGFGQRHQAKKIHPEWSQYAASPFASQQLSNAKNLFYAGRMAGGAQMDRNILSSQANYQDNINRNATNSSQALALGAAAQGQTDQAFANQSLQEQQNQQNLLGNLNQAYGANINEGDKVYQSKLMKYQMDSQQKQALLGAGAQNIFGGAGDLSSLGIYSGQLGKNGNSNGGAPLPAANASNNTGGSNWFNGWTPKDRYQTY